MAHESAAVMDGLVMADRAAVEQDVARLRQLGLRERGILIESACAATAAIDQSRLAAGLPAVEPAPWPPSTCEFLREHLARVRA
jgi:hypothetical protein